MKKLLLTFILSSIIVAVSAQDMFTNNNRSLAIDSKNMSLNKKSTSFGLKSTYDFSATSSMNEGDRPFIKRAMFNMYIDWNLHSGKSNPSPFGFTWGGGMYFTFGARIYDYVFVGAGFGAEILPCLSTYNISWYYDTYIDGFFNIPAFINVRAFIPATDRIYPYLDVAAGPSVSFYLDQFEGFEILPIAFNLRVGLCVDFSRFSLGVGYEGLFGKIDRIIYEYNTQTGEIIDYWWSRDKLGVHTAYLKLGIRIGPME